MGRLRKSLRATLEGKKFVVRFRHPLTQRIVRFVLGCTTDEKDTNLGKLNKLFLDPEAWQNPPDDIPKTILDQWRGDSAGVKLRGGQVTVDGESLQVDHREVARLAADVKFLKEENITLRAENKRLRKQLEHWMGKKLRSGPTPTLQAAFDTFMRDYQGRDPDHTEEVRRIIKFFIGQFKPDTEIDAMEGREREIDGWLRGLKSQKGPTQGKPIGPERRGMMRKVILKFLTDSGALMDRKAIAAPRREEMRQGRGQIRWLEKPQARKVAAKLSQPWKDMFRVQVGTGLRPDELITLKRSDFSADLKTLLLSPLGNLTLKEGPRSIHVPVVVAKIVRRRLDRGDIIFLDPRSRQPWKTAKDFNEKYRTALQSAGEATKAPFKLDCRTGRRTCASILLRAGHSTEEVGALLGDDPRMIREHYARILPSEVDPSAAAI